MKEPRIKFSYDRLELNFDLTQNSKTIKRDVTVFHRDIESVTIEYCKENVSRNKIYESERIVIRTRKTRVPIVYYGIKEFDWYDNYKTGLRKFANDNKIELIDEVLT